MARLNVGQAPDMARLRKGSHTPYFTDEESETQRGETACPWPHSIYWTRAQVLSLVSCSLLSQPACVRWALSARPPLAEGGQATVRAGECGVLAGKGSPEAASGTAGILVHGYEADPKWRLLF